MGTTTKRNSIMGLADWLSSWFTHAPPKIGTRKIPKVYWSTVVNGGCAQSWTKSPYQSGGDPVIKELAGNSGGSMTANSCPSLGYHYTSGRPAPSTQYGKYANYSDHSTLSATKYV